MDLKKTAKKLWPYILPFLGGAMLPFAFLPYNMIITAYISPAILLYVINNSKKPIFMSWLYGLGVFSFGIYWVFYSIHDYSDTPAPIAMFFTGLLIAAMAAYFSLLSYLTLKLFKQANYGRHLLGFPALWVLVEAFRGWFLSGFPWLFIGYTQSGTNIKAFATIGGVWLVSWVTVFLSALLYVIFRQVYDLRASSRIKYIAGLSFIGVWVGAYFLGQYPFIEYSSNSPVNVALVQGNVAQLERWDEAHVKRIMALYQDLSYKNLDADIIVWPESAIPLPLPFSKGYFANFDEVAKKSHTAIFSGVPQQNANDEFLNAIYSFGEGHGLYHKSQLVPFGEYVPLGFLVRGLIGLFNIPMSNFVSGDYHAPLSAFGLNIAPTICYEIAYPNLVRNQAQNTSYILNISNDAWFGRSIGPYQHLQIAQFRALENGQHLLRATNSGFTAVISPEGLIKGVSPQFEQHVLRKSLPMTQGQTVWNKIGPYPIYLVFITLVIIGMLRSPKKK